MSGVGVSWVQRQIEVLFRTELSKQKTRADEGPGFEIGRDIFA